MSSCARSTVCSTGRLTGGAFTRIPLHRSPRLPAHLLDLRPFLRLAQDERDLLLTELRPLYGLFPDRATKSYPRLFSQWVIPPGSKSLIPQQGRLGGLLALGSMHLGQEENLCRREM